MRLLFIQYLVIVAALKTSIEINSFLTFLGQLCWNRSLTTSTPDVNLSTENVISGIAPDIMVRIWPPKSVLSIKQSFSPCWCAHWNLFNGSWKLKKSINAIWFGE